MTLKKVDFEKAYELFRLSKSGDLAATDNLFKILIPLAKTLAEKKFRQYRNGPMAVHMDSEDCLSAAVEALNDVIRDTPYNPDYNNHQFASMLIRAINSAHASMERLAHTRTDSLPKLGRIRMEEGLLREADYDPPVGLTTMLYGEKLDLIKPVLREHLNDMEYQVMAALIDSIPRNLSLKQLGRELNIPENSIKSNLRRARMKLNDVRSPIGPMIEEIIKEMSQREPSGAHR